MSRKVAVLKDRGVVRVAGEDARRLLQGLVTNSMDRLEANSAIFAGLLSPQGKILFEFFIVRAGDGYLLDTAREAIGELIKRLNFYKLRAKASFTDQSAEYAVAAMWGAPAPTAEVPPGWVVYADPRLPELGLRALVPTSAPLSGEVNTTEEDYHAHRIALGVPQAGLDYAAGDTFPHEALYDQLNGVDFTKGCYVGQEIVSRMEHRGTARKRIVPVRGQGPLARGQQVTAGAATIGSIGSVSGNRALALLRLDRAAEALEKKEPITAGGIPLVIELPAWARFTLPSRKDVAQA
jgi:folate-binding protein YgfZ